MASKESYVITKKNNQTEKEAINYILSENKGFYLPDLEQRKLILQSFNLDNKFSRAFDLIYVEDKTKLNWDKIDLNEVTLIELKTTKKELTNNPHGFFFGATQNEFDLAEKLGNRYKFCFVSLHNNSLSYKLLNYKELEGLIKNKRVQYQINLK